jgi:single-strand DNA-binding protein
LNKVELIGRITKDLELKYTQSQKQVLSFTIAVNKRVNGENSADFINCVAWNTTAEFISKYFKKGQTIAAIGRLQNRSYEDDKGKHYITEVVVEEAEFVGNKVQEKEDTEKQYEEFYENNNDLPF